MILLIDNYDSFSYNLYQLIGETDPDVKVVRNDAVTVEEVSEMRPNAVVLSPGPGRPSDAGICVSLVRELGGKVPILGVCLGHQAVFEAYGGKVSYAKKQMHGKQSEIRLSPECAIFKGCPEKVPAARYHSLAAVPETLPACLTIAAESECGEVMAVCHKKFDVYGLQFHPESVMTPDGYRMMKNFLRIAEIGK
ncbi:MAG: aminodeoxychorismate/anthranilate synthase component II [Candidatus Methanoplasma sp.]|jgi:anthranilate synthase component 2|nr:aminodeoxychorismate/anthranilate synthase component II [Candidatus Methanoplasma sp.]